MKRIELLVLLTLVLLFILPQRSQAKIVVGARKEGSPSC